MKFNRQKRVAKQLEIGKQRALKIKRKERTLRAINHAVLGYISVYKGKPKNYQPKLTDLINSTGFMVASAMFLEEFLNPLKKPKNVKKIDAIPINLNEYLNKYLPKTQNNNYESLQISPPAKTL